MRIAYYRYCSTVCDYVLCSYEVGRVQSLRGSFAGQQYVLEERSYRAGCLFFRCVCVILLVGWLLDPP